MQAGGYLALSRICIIIEYPINSQARDPWHFPRTNLAKQIVGMAKHLYSPRRTGKTQFVVHDLIPEAENCGYRPVYTDLWRNTNDSAQALANGFLRAYEELTPASSRAGKTLKQQVRGVRAMGFGVELGDVDRPTPPQDGLSQVGFWLDAAVAASDKPLHTTTITLAEPQKMMQDWANYLDKLKTGAQRVIGLESPLGRTGAWPA